MISKSLHLYDKAKKCIQKNVIYGFMWKIFLLIKFYWLNCFLRKCNDVFCLVVSNFYWQLLNSHFNTMFFERLLDHLISRTKNSLKLLHEIQKKSFIEMSNILLFFFDKGIVWHVFALRIILFHGIVWFH